MRIRIRPALIGVVLLLVPAVAGAAGMGDLESQIQQYTLPNGLTFVVLERHDAPVFSWRAYVDAGSVDEVPGITGVAHMFEHMSAKGTATIGTTDYGEEAEALQEVDEAMAALVAEQQKGQEADSTKLRQLEAAFKDAQAAAKTFVIDNESSKILESNGVVGLNASTFTDWTAYYYSLPSNRLELWARLEGEWFTSPVLREYYSERDVVYEERRLQESSPIGRLYLNWISAAYEAHPYGVGGIIGYSADLKSITRADAQAFFDKYYVASNITIAIVGDVTMDQVKELADKYWSGVHTGPKPPRVRTVEPRHDYEIRVVREEEAQPFVIVGYHVPAADDPDWPAVELLADILGAGRTSRIYTKLVKEDQIAAQAGAGAGFLGTKYPTLLAIQALVASGATTDEVEEGIYEVTGRLVEEGPTEEELQKVKTLNRAAFIRGLRPNSGLATQLSQYEELWGDWRKMFQYLDRLDAVTTADVQRVAQEVLRPGNRVVGILKRPEGGPQS